jgi:urease accessory protein
MVMAFGGLLGLLGVPIPGVEIGIALSGLVMGLMVLFEIRPPLGLAAVIVAAFALFHGHAHGSELPAGSNALLYSLAFVMATGLLHLMGILLGETRRWPGGRRFVQAAGAGVAMVGLWFLEQALR